MNIVYRSLQMGVVLFVLCASTAWAQDGVPPFQDLRFNEDWSDYPDEGIDSIFDPIKRIDLSESVWLSIGGEIHGRFEGWNNFGFSNANDDIFTFYRTFLHTDLHIGDHWRFFVEGRFAGLTDRNLPGGRRDALDADYGDLWNAFVEAKYDLGRVSMRVRLGRQELRYGIQHLVSPLDWANNRRIFEGGVVQIKSLDGPWTADFWVTSPVVLDRHEFNEHDDHRLFSGAYVTRTFSKQRIKGADFYFFAQNGVNSAPALQDRYTIGSRVWGEVIDNLAYDVQGAYQFGEVGAADISAYMLMGDLTYTFAETKFKPFINAGAGYASGDDDPTDGDVGTFDQIYPFGHYWLGFIDVIGRQNIIDLHGQVGFWPIAKKMRLRADLHFFWLADNSDALYHAGGGVMRPALGGTSEVGSEIDLSVLYKINRHLTIFSGYSHFFAGALIEDTGPSEDIDFFYTQVDFTF